MTYNTSNYWDISATTSIVKTVFRYKTQFLNNYYLNNYGSGNKGIISIQGVPIFDFKNEYFKNNGDSYSQILDNLGGNFKKISDYHYGTNIPSTMKSFIHFDFAYCPHISNLTVNGGFKYSLTYNKYQS